jgi:hypothetical protein
VSQRSPLGRGGGSVKYCKWPCSHHSKRAKPCQDGTVIREHSVAKRSKVKHLKADVRRKIKHLLSSNSPRDRGEVVNTNPHTSLDFPVGKSDEGHASPECMSSWPDPMHSQVCNKPPRAVPSTTPQFPVNSRNDNPYGHPMAVPLIRHCHLDGGKLCQNNEVVCFVNKDVSKRRTVPMALSPAALSQEKHSVMISLTTVQWLFFLFLCDSARNYLAIVLVVPSFIILMKRIVLQDNSSVINGRRLMRHPRQNQQGTHLVPNDLRARKHVLHPQAAPKWP